ncbi:MAG: tetratricopeptide repeat protein [Verrucomicrobiia bacterium]|jgi:hypothetical protein
MRYKFAALISLATLAGAFVFAGCATTGNEGQAQASQRQATETTRTANLKSPQSKPEWLIPGNTGSASDSSEFEIVSTEIKKLVKGLEYSDKVAEEFTQMVSGWKNKHGESVLIAWKHRLTQARQDYQRANISKARLAIIERDVVKDLTRIQKEVSFDYSFDLDDVIRSKFDLADVIRSKQAQCLGCSQLVFIVGNSVGLPVQAISVFKGRTGLLWAGNEAHVACIVNLSDGRSMMVDLAGAGLAGARSFVSEPFIIDEKFRRVGNYLELKDETSPLRIHRRIQVLDRAGLVSAIYSNRGVVSDRLRQYAQAISDYNKAIELNPKNAEAYDNRGVTYAKSGLFTQAISDFNKAIDLNPQFANAYNNRGNAYGNLGQHAQAISDCNKAIEIVPKLAEAYITRGLGYFFLRKPEEAKKDLLKAVELKPALKPRVEQISHRFKLNL